MTSYIDIVSPASRNHYVEAERVKMRLEMKLAAQKPLEIPEFATALNSKAKAIFMEAYNSRPLHQWTDHDLMVLADYAVTWVELQDELEKYKVEGSVLPGPPTANGNPGKFYINPRRLVIRSIRTELTRMLHTLNLSPGDQMRLVYADKIRHAREMNKAMDAGDDIDSSDGLLAAPSFFDS